MAHEGALALENLLGVVGCRETVVTVGGGSGQPRVGQGTAADPYSHPRMLMFSRALMWDSSSCEATAG